VQEGGLIIKNQGAISVDTIPAGEADSFEDVYVILVALLVGS
jgi:hypothetical protein